MSCWANDVADKLMIHIHNTYKEYRFVYVDAHRLMSNGVNIDAMHRAMKAVKITRAVTIIGNHIGTEDIVSDLETWTRFANGMVIAVGSGHAIIVANKPEFINLFMLATEDTSHAGNN